MRMELQLTRFFAFKNILHILINRRVFIEFKNFLFLRGKRDEFFTNHLANNAF